MTLAERVREQLALPRRKKLRPSLDEVWRGVESESARLAPLHEALAQAVSALDSSIARYEDAEIRNPNATPLMKGCTLGVYRILIKAREAIEQALGGEG